MSIFLLEIHTIEEFCGRAFEEMLASPNTSSNLYCFDSSTKAQSHPAPDTPFSLVESGMKAMCKGSHFMSACEVFVLVVFKLLR